MGLTPLPRNYPLIVIDFIKVFKFCPGNTIAHITLAVERRNKRVLFLIGVIFSLACRTDPDPGTSTEGSGDCPSAEDLEALEALFQSEECTYTGGDHEEGDTITATQMAEGLEEIGASDKLGCVLNRACLAGQTGCIAISDAFANELAEACEIPEFSEGGGACHGTLLLSPGCYSLGDNPANEGACNASYMAYCASTTNPNGWDACTQAMLDAGVEHDFHNCSWNAENTICSSSGAAIGDNACTP